MMTSPMLMVAVVTVTILSTHLLTPVSCFVQPKPFISTNVKILPTSFTSSITQIKSSNSDDDEIAELEAKLRQLKEEKQKELLTKTSDDEPADTPTSNPINTGITNYDSDTPLNEMLSESWKESDSVSGGSDEEGGSIVPALLSGVALILGFILFSQIPVGQEAYDKYSTAKPNTSIDLGDKAPAGLSSFIE